jgi:FlaA1/EpsC-like NDP-sugar epimerase
MGATKRMAELVALRGAGRSPAAPVIVRFGNVLGSSGSVVEIMLRCVAEGRPLPVTDDAATRYFMTGAEAVALVLKASLIGRGGEVFWLDMGAPIAIGDLARRIIELATPAGQPRVPLQVIGLRPGEKLREELTTQGLAMRRTADPQIWVARQAEQDDAAVTRAMATLRGSVDRGDAASALSALCSAVPEFEPSEAAVASTHRGRRLLEKIA